MPEEFFNELSEKTTSVTIKEFTPEGVRVSFNLQGQVKGRYEAAHMETANGLLKPDGTSEFEILAIDQTTEGDTILIHGKGTSRRVSPTTAHVEATGTYQTASKKFAWLNSTKGRFEGTINLPTGELGGKVFVQK